MTLHDRITIFIICILCFVLGGVFGNSNHTLSLTCVEYSYEQQECIKFEKKNNMSIK